MSSTIKTPSGFYLAPLGNSKVQFPLINLGSGTDCPSQRFCPFSIQNHKASGRPLCYAQKIERLRPNVLASRHKNAFLIATIEPDFLAAEIVYRLVSYLVKTGCPISGPVRLNESGDISAENIMFSLALVRCLKKAGFSPYLYSKAPSTLQAKMRQAGAVVLHSERDFVAVKKPEVEKTGLPLCPGKCSVNSCTRCPDGKKSCIIEH